MDVKVSYIFSTRQKRCAISGLRWRDEYEKPKYAYMVNSVMFITFQENNRKSTASLNTWKLQSILIT